MTRRSPSKSRVSIRSAPLSSCALAQSQPTATGWKLPHCLSNHPRPATASAAPPGRRDGPRRRQPWPAVVVRDARLAEIDQPVVVMRQRVGLGPQREVVRGPAHATGEAVRLAVIAGDNGVAEFDAERSRLARKRLRGQAHPLRGLMRAGRRVRQPRVPDVERAAARDLLHLEHDVVQGETLPVLRAEVYAEVPPLRLEIVGGLVGGQRQRRQSVGRRRGGRGLILAAG